MWLHLLIIKSLCTLLCLIVGIGPNCKFFGEKKGSIIVRKWRKNTPSPSISKILIISPQVHFIHPPTAPPPPAPPYNKAQRNTRHNVSMPTLILPYRRIDVLQSLSLLIINIQYNSKNAAGYQLPPRTHELPLNISPQRKQIPSISPPWLMSSPKFNHHIYFIRSHFELVKCVIKIRPTEDFRIKCILLDIARQAYWKRGN